MMAYFAVSLFTAAMLVAGCIFYLGDVYDVLFIAILAAPSFDPLPASSLHGSLARARPTLLARFFPHPPSPIYF